MFRVKGKTQSQRGMLLSFKVLPNGYWIILLYLKISLKHSLLSFSYIEWHPQARRIFCSASYHNYLLAAQIILISDS